MMQDKANLKRNAERPRRVNPFLDGFLKSGRGNPRESTKTNARFFARL